MNFSCDTYSALRERQSGAEAIPQSMPPSFYNDPAVYKTEVDQIFLTSWICVGRADEILTVGDYYVCEFVDEPLIVVCGISTRTWPSQ